MGWTADALLDCGCAKEPFTVAGLSSFAQDNAGELYLMSVGSGYLYRLQP